jgi:hypothetical protein
MLFMQRLMLLAALSLSAGCVPNDCDWAKPIRPTSGDLQVASPDLIEDVLVHNRSGAKFCGWRP